LDGWINTDLPGEDHRIDMPLDITKALPFPDNYFTAIYGSEVIEHVARKEASFFLSEARRTLRPCDILRFPTPDIEAVCAIYLGNHPRASLDMYRKAWINGEFSRDIWINAAFRSYGHQFLYSFETLSAELCRAGFSTITRVEAQQTSSSVPQLKNLETHYGDGPIELYCSGMIIEATK
jgi:predicted SAM-dependent methyltransferase